MKIIIGDLGMQYLLLCFFLNYVIRHVLLNPFVISLSNRVDSARDGGMNASMIPSSNHTTPYNTLSRPISAQGYDDNTLSAGRMPRHDDQGNYSHHGSRPDMDGYLAMNQSNPALFDQNNRGSYSHERIPVRWIFSCLQI